MFHVFPCHPPEQQRLQFTEQAGSSNSTSQARDATETCVTERQEDSHGRWRNGERQILRVSTINYITLRIYR